jgi:hypothetical protein
MANNPNPAARFLRNAATTALFVDWGELPGEQFIANRTPVQLAQAHALLQNSRRKTGAIRRARRNFSQEIEGLLERWRIACTVPT